MNKVQRKEKKEFPTFGLMVGRARSCGTCDQGSDSFRDFHRFYNIIDNGCVYISVYTHIIIRFMHAFIYIDEMNVTEYICIFVRIHNLTEKHTWRV